MWWSMLTIGLKCPSARGVEMSAWREPPSRRVPFRSEGCSSCAPTQGCSFRERKRECFLRCYSGSIAAGENLEAVTESRCVLSVSVAAVSAGFRVRTKPLPAKSAPHVAARAIGREAVHEVRRFVHLIVPGQFPVVEIRRQRHEPSGSQAIRHLLDSGIEVPPFLDDQDART